MKSEAQYVTSAGLALPHQFVAGEDQVDLRMNIPLSHCHLQSEELKVLIIPPVTFCKVLSPLTVMEAGLSNVENILSGLQCH